MSEYGYLKKDDDGHWYLVPEDLCEQFDQLTEAMEGMDWMEVGTSDECEQFNNAFGEYMIDGPYGLRIEMDQPEA